MRIVDKTGKVYRSEAWYPMMDPISGHRFEPGEDTKVDPNAWIDAQPFMRLVEAPAKEAATVTKSGSLSK